MNSPLCMALRDKNPGAAREILNQTQTLTRQEGGLCALLTLQWAPDLLEAILDRVPGGHFYWMRHEISLPGEENVTLRLQGSLVMIAAALDDLPALECLLRRGAPADYQFQRDRWRVLGDMVVDGIMTPVPDSLGYSLHQVKDGTPFPEDSGRVLLHADPLSAAIFCGAQRCTQRLLREPGVSVTPAARRALAVTPENRAQQLGIPLEELLRPEDFGPGLDHSALLPVALRHGLGRRKLEELLREDKASPTVVISGQRIDLLSLAEPQLLGDVVWQVWSECRGREDLMELARTLSLPLDRCRVEEKTLPATVRTVLDAFQITGQPPEGGLSGLAAAMLGCLSIQAMSVEQLLSIPGAAEVLGAEEPELIFRWLDSHPEVPTSRKLVLTTLLKLQKEVNYAL